jgi:GrpB-like predicted nucleotidyltransferase (UPF0157 family)
LVTAETCREVALAVLAAQRERLRGLGVPGDLVLVGGCSVPGALTRGDVDLHLRVPPDAFRLAVDLLREHYPVVHPDIWTTTLATFDVPPSRPSDPSVGIAVTPCGSEHDLRFTRSWQLLAADPALLEEYNTAKLAGESDIDGPGYEARKSAVFDRLVELWPRHPAGGLMHHQDGPPTPPGSLRRTSPAPSPPTPGACSRSAAAPTGG